MTKLPNIDINNITTLEEAKNVIEQVMAINRQLFAEIKKLKAEIAKLKKQAKLPKFSSNPTSDYSAGKQLRKRSSQEDTWNKQPKKQSIPIDQEMPLQEITTCDCGGNHFKTLRSREKLIQGIIIRRNNIRYFGRDKQCLNCGKLHQLQIPRNIKGLEFDSSLRTWVSQLKYDCRYSEPLIHSFLTGLGIRISIGQISRILLTNSHKLIPAYTHLRIWGIKISRYLHTDATGMKRQLLTTGRVAHQHLHFVGHKLLSLFKITRKYNSNQMAIKVLTKRGINKIMISDDHSANGSKLPVKYKQLCWLHEIRHYLKLLPALAENKQQLEKVINQWWQLYQLAKNYGRDPTPFRRLTIIKRFYQLISQETPYRALVKRLKLTRKKTQRMLTFLDHPYLPIENNLAERDLRPAVILRKISGALKSKAGDRSFERHLSIIRTTKKQGLDVFQTLHGLLNGHLSPFVLTAKTLAVTPEY